MPTDINEWNRHTAALFVCVLKHQRPFAFASKSTCPSPRPQQFSKHHHIDLSLSLPLSLDLSTSRPLDLSTSRPLDLSPLLLRVVCLTCSMESPSLPRFSSDIATDCCVETQTPEQRRQSDRSPCQYAAVSNTQTQHTTHNTQHTTHNTQHNSHSVCTMPGSLYAWKTSLTDSTMRSSKYCCAPKAQASRRIMLNHSAVSPKLIALRTNPNNTSMAPHHTHVSLARLWAPLPSHAPRASHSTAHKRRAVAANLHARGLSASRESHLVHVRVLQPPAIVAIQDEAGAREWCT